MPSDAVQLSDVVRRVGGCLKGDGTVPVSDVTHDSRSARPGALFAAIRGRKVDGHDYVRRAAERGAGSVLVERFVPCSLPQVRVADTRGALGPAASLVHGDPTRRLDVVGITGTNGKTTVTLMLESIARRAGRRYARIGTLGTAFAGRHQPLTLTTPEASDLHRMFAAMVEEGISLVAMEVSSHALALKRVDSTSFAVAAFTNLSQDHLDFHHDMDSYFAAKQRLFDGRASVHVIDVTTEAGRKMAGSARGRVVTVGSGSGHDVGITEPEPGLSGSRFVLLIDGTAVAVKLRPGGLHNIRNAAMAVACARALGIGVGDIVDGLQEVRRIPGRLDPVNAGQPFDVLVDYAHTPAAVEMVVESSLAYGRGATIVVVGAAGERDTAKRPLLGAAAAKAHLAVITSDNPRSEDPALLVDEVAAGTVGGRAEVVREVDRRKAIRLAVERAGPGDTVLILGKGHEQYQDLGAEVIPFDDGAVAASLLGERWARPDSTGRATAEAPS